MKAMGNSVKKLTGKGVVQTIEKGTAFLSAVFILIMVCLIATDVAGRYLFNSPIRGSYEIIENYLMIFLVYFGLAYAYREGAHIRLTILENHLPSRTKTGINYFVQAFSCLYIVLLFIATTRTNLVNKFTEKLDLARNLTPPLWPSYAVISGGLLLMALLIFLDLWRVRKGESGLFKEETDF
jgi:TRAP-type C4-dicarboxylate transport system permease small subunit